ncbi:MAG: Holliday junction resolvase RuvX [Chitinophagales bacterium]|nr:Holliday junction resolvase RuvX [Chitinophagales bacterium]
MSKIVAIDYGKKRVGFAISDETLTFAFGLSTQENKNALQYIINLIEKEKIETIIIGYPKNLNNELMDLTKAIDVFIKQIQQKYSSITIEKLDERFTSKLAFQSMIDSGLKKKQRQNKALVDEISATILLQDYITQLAFRKKQNNS